MNRLAASLTLAGLCLVIGGVLLLTDIPDVAGLVLGVAGLQLAVVGLFFLDVDDQPPR